MPIFHSSKAQVYFDVEQDPNYKCIWTGYEPTADPAKLPVYEYNRIKEVFDYIALESGLQLNFPHGGCQQRAQVMSLILKKFKIEHCKVWLFAPVDLDIEDSRTLFVMDINAVGNSDTISWNYHVAPLVSIQQDDKIETFVIDPSIVRSGPALLIDWFQRIGNSQISKFTFLKDDKYFFNVKYDNGRATSVIDGCFYEWVNPAKDNLIMEKGLAVNDVAIYVNEKYVKPLLGSKIQNDMQTVRELREMFGNASTIENLISQNLGGNAAITSHRYAMSKHPEIILDARQHFNQRLRYWTTYSNILTSPDQHLPRKQLQQNQPRQGTGRPPENDKGKKRKK